jgi:Sulfatase-modifying factor enzyme 1
VSVSFTTRRWIRRTLALGLCATGAALGVFEVGASAPAPPPREIGGLCYGPPPRATQPHARAAAAPPKAELKLACTVPPPRAACPPDMVHVTGEYCTVVRQTCQDWLDEKALPFARCKKYEAPARCTGTHVHMDFCIDRYEYTAPGQTLPENFESFVTASKTCHDLGKRICAESEWNFACEGEAMRPYPYGFQRLPVCNQDRPNLYVPGTHQHKLRDLRAPARANPRCISPFGVYDMVGNLDEPVLRDDVHVMAPFRNALKGGWWMAARNRCRPATTAHDDYYNGIQTGVRCCKDPARAKNSG